MKFFSLSLLLAHLLYTHSMLNKSVEKKNKEHFFFAKIWNGNISQESNRKRQNTEKYVKYYKFLINEYFLRGNVYYEFY